MKLISQFSKTIFPCIDIHTYSLYSYHGKYSNWVDYYEGYKKDSYTVYPKILSEFLIEQFQKDMEMLYKPKEILFIGRSNVGKSSLINAITNQQMGKVSKKSGSTLKLHFHHIPKLHGYIVDAPGYGFASINVKAVKQLQGMIYTYIKTSSRLCKIYLLLDSEHGIKNNDDDFNIQIQIVLTKFDKIDENHWYDRQLYFARLLKQYKNIHPLMHSVSVKNVFGINEIRYSLIDGFAQNQARNTYGREEDIIKYIRAHKRPKILDINKDLKNNKQNILEGKQLTSK
ncbi:hypothetical protein pb186bvf_015102 [Paramecium bursaria]